MAQYDALRSSVPDRTFGTCCSWPAAGGGAKGKRLKAAGGTAGGAAGSGPAIKAVESAESLYGKRCVYAVFAHQQENMSCSLSAWRMAWSMCGGLLGRLLRCADGGGLLASAMCCL